MCLKLTRPKQRKIKMRSRRCRHVKWKHKEMLGLQKGTIPTFIAWLPEHTTPTPDRDTHLPQPEFPAFLVQLELISGDPMLKHALKWRSARRAEVTRQLLNVEGRVDLIIALVFTPLFDLEVWNAMRRIPAQYLWNYSMAFVHTQSE